MTIEEAIKHAEEVERTERLITEENKKQNKVLEDVASSLKELNEILKNNAKSRITTRWTVITKYYNFVDTLLSLSEANVIAETKKEAFERAKERGNEPERAEKIRQCIISAEDIIIS